MNVSYTNLNLPLSNTSQKQRRFIPILLIFFLIVVIYSNIPDSDIWGDIAYASENGDVTVTSSALENSTATSNDSATALASDKLSASFSAQPKLLTDRVAVMIETRHLSTLIPLLLHFGAVLGPTWPIILYTDENAYQNISEHPSVKRQSHQIHVRKLPTEVQLNTHQSISRFLTETWIWEDLAPADHILMFQTDSVICANAPTNIDDFLSFDFIGAPILKGLGKGWNGGLSLRNRQKVLQIVQEEDWEEESTRIRNSYTNAEDKGDLVLSNGYSIDYEDQWIAYKMSLKNDSILPSTEEAKRFSVETVYPDKSKGEPMPLGFHQITRFVNDAQLQEVLEWCPEVKLTIGKDPRFKEGGPS